MKLLITPLTLALLTSTALAAHPCDDGTAPEGWLRDGGYCELRENLSSTIKVQATSLDPMSDIYFPLADGDPNS